MGNMTAQAFDEPYTDVDILLLGLCPIAEGHARGIPNAIHVSRAPSHRAKSWKAEELPFGRFLSFLMDHLEGTKVGSAWSPFVFEGERRNAEASRRADLFVYDCDAVEGLDSIRGRISGRGYASLIVSSHSHMTDRTEVKRPLFEHWAENNRGASAADFLRSKGLIDEIAQSALLLPENAISALLDQQGPEIMIRCKHPLTTHHAAG